MSNSKELCPFKECDEFNTAPNIIELLSKNDMNFIGAFTKFIGRTWTVAASMNRNGTKLAICTTNREILIIDALSLELINIIKHKELSPNLWSILWNKNEENQIIFSSKNGVIEVWDVIKPEFKYKCPAPTDFIYVLNQVKINNDDYLQIATSEYLFFQSMNKMNQKQDVENMNKSRLTLKYHTITCCGIDLSFNGDGKCDYIAVGDLGCSLFIWCNAKTSNYNHYKPLIKKSCVLSIRSLKWIPNTNIIFVGSLDGSLSLYKFNENDIKKETDLLPVIYNCNNSAITCIEYKYQYKNGIK